MSESDQTGLSDELYMDAQDAAAELGVNVNTVYSYVSRKRLRTRQVPGTRQRLYWRADIARAKAEMGKRVVSAKVQDDTDITLLTPQGPFYRGRNAIELSDHMTLEETAALLWQVDEHQAFTFAMPALPPEMVSMGSLLDHATSTDKAIALLPFLERANLRALDLSHAGMCRTGADILRWYTAILTDADKPSDAPLHEQIANFLGAPAAAGDLVRRSLVLFADHGFGAGTYAVRAVASTGVTAYRSVLAGLTIFSGSRTSIGRSAGVWHFLREIGDSPDPKAVVSRRLREGERIPGFEALPAYAGQDPRAKAMIDAIEQVYGSHPLFKKARHTAELLHETLDTFPNLTFAYALMGQLIGLEPHRVLFVLGRSTGWIAHSIEQSLSGDYAPPSATYRGILPPLPL